MVLVCAVRIFIIKNGLSPYVHNFGRVEEGVVAMRDGVRLHARAYSQKGGVLWPPILIRHPYISMDTLFAIGGTNYHI